MIGVKKLGAGVVVFMMLVIAQVAFAADQDPAVY